MFVCLLDKLIPGFCYGDLEWETGGFELASTIILVLQAKRLTKCGSHILRTIYGIRPGAKWVDVHKIGRILGTNAYHTFQTY